MAVVGDLTPSARAIVIREGKMLVMRRSRKAPARNYMVTPGGRVEENETNEETVLREVAEETTVIVANPRLMFIEDPNDAQWGLQYIYLCDYLSGEPGLPEDSPEYEIQQKGDGTYEPMWLPVKEALFYPGYPFKSPRLRDEIENALMNGFPTTPKRWTLSRPVLE